MTGNDDQSERWVMDERVSAQTKKCVCFISGAGSVMSLLMLNAACVVLIVWALFGVNPRASRGCPVQDVMDLTARLSKGEKFR